MKYHILTYGCQMNQSDSKRISFLLQKQGHKPVKAGSSAGALAKAGLIVINACSVRQSAMHRVYAKINQIKSLSRAKLKDKKIILAGCVLEADKKKLADKISGFWHPDDYFYCLPFSPGSVLGDSPRTDPGVAFIPIMTGCNNFCSYCVVPYTRGREKSRPADEIIKEVKLLIKKGHKEIMLLGQNVNSYFSPSLRGAKRRSNLTDTPRDRHARPPTGGLARDDVYFPTLLRLINATPGNFTIKFMTSHPKDMSDKLIDTIAECEKISKEIHLPIQSGDNTILRKMNRKYTVTHYKKLIKKIRAKIPTAVISTDVIVGFPGETKKQFANTVKLFKELKFSKAYVAMYSPRPGTAAYKLEDNVPIQEKKRRWKILEKITNKKSPSSG